MAIRPAPAPRPRPWPSANAFSAAVQNPSTAFDDPLLRTAAVARDRLGMPFVMSGNFAYVFKLDLASGGSRAVKCFRRALGDRAPRFEAIDAHLERLRFDDIARFEFDPDGVKVEGAGWPVLVMEWVDGPTLDVYVGELLRGPDPGGALRGLAEQWGELVRKLEDAGIAHGDLQHGNVIVTSGGMKLVDLDGMFVPALRGTGSPGEVGHRHYQHPARTVADFDESLDRFASIVIHLSLLAVAADPSLWREFHDDNLVFARSDFERPAASRLFARLAAMGGDVAPLAGALRAACGGSLSAVPALTRLVTVKRSTLPLWIRQPVVPTVARKTRQASADEIAAAAAAGAVPPVTPQAPPPPPRRPWSRRPATPQPASQPASQHPPAQPRPPLQWAQPNPPAPPPATPSRATGGRLNPWGRRRTPSRIPWTPPSGWPPEGGPSLRRVAKVAAVVAFLGIPFGGLWWTPLARVVEALGVRPASFLHAPAVIVVYLGVVTGLVWAAAHLFRRDGSLRAPVLAGGLPPSSSAFVASTLLCVYHRPGCALVGKIGVRNRVWLQHAYEAQAGGFQPCAVCRP